MHRTPFLCLVDSLSVKSRKSKQKLIRVVCETFEELRLKGRWVGAFLFSPCISVGGDKLPEKQMSFHVSSQRLKSGYFI
ncbi:hypothetical protein CEXT_721301 [Caerostris extrusa]|uniref:Uncharacterized protein n=1 Tax=Caerostris extrusa TaxID=172846 RepID=A0AAV4Q857_CAEEX|nr:hypothetical protein CEXT_721301 [Caerostris extrusa]